jgi:sarcosine oxidase, subunit gamma
MSDCDDERSPVRSLAGRTATIPLGRLEISLAPAAARFTLRCKPEDAEELAGVFTIPLPKTICRAAVAGARALLWLGPDEWMLLADDGSQSLIENSFNSISSRICFSLVDISQRHAGLILRGAAAVDLLSVGCPLDLHDTVFPGGSCTRTIFGKCEVVLWRASTDIFRLEFERSYADYVWRLVQVACSDIASGLRLPALGSQVGHRAVNDQKSSLS